MKIENCKDFVLLLLIIPNTKNNSGIFFVKDSNNRDELSKISTKLNKKNIDNWNISSLYAVYEKEWLMKTNIDNIKF